jgi:hypothetical protein
MALSIALSGGFVAACWPAWFFARQRRAWYDWDYMSLFAPLPLWLVLTILHIGSNDIASLVVEPILVALFVPVALSLRVFLLDNLFKDIGRISKFTLGACLFLPLWLRLVMPWLPAA